MTPWFQHVLKQGWHVVGRLRGTTKSRIGEGEWQSVHELHEGATSRPRYLGQAQVGKYTDTADLFHLYFTKEEPKDAQVQVGLLKTRKAMHVWRKSYGY